MKVVNLDDIKHGIRVAKSSVDLAILMNLSKNEIDDLHFACLFHDVGKAHINQSILNKNGKLNNIERLHIQEHPVFSHQEIKNLGYSSDVADIILYHHENYDGSGYPNGLKGNTIPIGARILKITDVFDALTMERPYRNQLSIQEALVIMMNEKEHYDPELYKMFLGYLAFKYKYISTQKGGNITEFQIDSSLQTFKLSKTLTTDMHTTKLENSDIQLIRNIAKNETVDIALSKHIKHG